MNSLKRWLHSPKRSDSSLLAQFYFADADLNSIAAELDSFEGRKDPERCTALVNQLRTCQAKVLNIIFQMMEETVKEHRAPRDFRVKFPDDVIQDNLAGQLWFGAECLAAGSSIMNREVESAAMRPLARALTKNLDSLRTILRDQCLKSVQEYTRLIRESLVIFDKLFAEFELSYVSAMVPVKSAHEYDMIQEITVLFSETVQRSVDIGLLSQDTIDEYDPALMFTIPRLAIISGLLVFKDGPLNPDNDPWNMSEMFRPFQTLLIKIRELLSILSEKELALLENALCSQAEPSFLATIEQQKQEVRAEKKKLLRVSKQKPSADVSEKRIRAESEGDDNSIESELTAVEIAERLEALAQNFESTRASRAEALGNQVLGSDSKSNQPGGETISASSSVESLNSSTSSSEEDDGLDQTLEAAGSQGPSQLGGSGVSGNEDTISKTSVPSLCGMGEEEASYGTSKSHSQAVLDVQSESTTSPLCSASACPAQCLSSPVGAQPECALEEPVTVPDTAATMEDLPFSIVASTDSGLFSDLLSQSDSQFTISSSDSHQLLAMTESSLQGPSLDSPVELMAEEASSHPSLSTNHCGQVVTTTKDSTECDTANGMIDSNENSSVKCESITVTEDSDICAKTTNNQIINVVKSILSDTPTTLSETSITQSHDIPTSFVSSGLHSPVMEESCGWNHSDEKYSNLSTQSVIDQASSAGPDYEGNKFNECSERKINRDHRVKEQCSSTKCEICSTKSNGHESCDNCDKSTDNPDPVLSNNELLSSDPESQYEKQREIERNADRKPQDSMPENNSLYSQSFSATDMCEETAAGFSAQTIQSNDVQAISEDTDTTKVRETDLSSQDLANIEPTVLGGTNSQESASALDTQTMVELSPAESAKIWEQQYNGHVPVNINGCNYVASGTHSQQSSIQKPLSNTPESQTSEEKGASSTKDKKRHGRVKKNKSKSSRGRTREPQNGPSSSTDYNKTLKLPKIHPGKAGPIKHLTEADEGHSSDTSSYTSDSGDREEIALAMEAAEKATRKKVRAQFQSSNDMIHRLFVCISGVADQLQTNFAGDLRNILRAVFDMHCSQKTEMSDSDKLEESTPLGAAYRAIRAARRSRNTIHRQEPPAWIPDDQTNECMSCQVPFTFVRRRHHCRNCGKIYCGRCSSNFVPLPHLGQEKAVRVCNRCFMFRVTPFTVRT